MASRLEASRDTAQPLSGLPESRAQIFSVRSSIREDGRPLKSPDDPRVPFQCRLRFQRWRNLDEDAAPNTY
jgi:hypothetical protein